MTDLPTWLDPASRWLARDRGALLLASSRVPEDAAREAAGSADLELVTVDAAVAGLLPFGVVRSAAADFLGGVGGSPDDGFCADAIGSGSGALVSWRALTAGWVGQPITDDLSISLSGDEMAAPPPAADTSVVDVELVRRVLAAVGETSPRLVHVRNAARLDGGSLAALRAMLAGGAHAGIVWLLDGPIPTDDPVHRALEPAIRAAQDQRFEGPGFATVTPPAPDASDAPSLPGRGSAVELLALLQAGGVPILEQMIGSASLAAYRGRSARSSWQDLEGLLVSGRARVEGGLVLVDAHGKPDPGPLGRADARALRCALGDCVAPSDPLFVALDPALALAGEAADAADASLAAGRAALRSGDAIAARRWLDATVGLRGRVSAEVALLRSEACRRLSEPESARRIAREALDSAQGLESIELHLEVGLASQALGDEKSALAYLERAGTRGGEAGAFAVAGAAWIALAELHQSGGRHGPGAKAAAEAARSFEQGGDSLSAAQAFATRAMCIAGAGQADRAIKELKLAMERTPDPDDPRPGALDVRIAMGMIFRDSGSRDKARQVLGLAVKRATAHAIADRGAIARLNLARFFLEGIPTRGPGRGEALASGRESAEIAVQQARSLGRADLEAEAEALLGELSWRSEDWEGAAAALAAEETLWSSIGQQARVIDVALRRGRLAVRRERWDEALLAAGTAMNQAQRRRMQDRLAQAHLLRAEALEKMDRGDEALASLQEAQRIYGSLGEAFAAQAGAAERRARALIAGKRGH